MSELRTNPVDKMPANRDTGADVQAKLAAQSTGVVWDVLRVMGLPHQAVSCRIGALESHMTFCGPAFCVKGQTWLGALPKVDSSAPQPRYELFKSISPGCIMVIDSGGYDEAVVMGENFAISATQAGCAGFVVDGAIRDAQGIADRNIPTFTRFVTPVSSAGRWSITGFDVQVNLPGQTAATVAVNPGDFVLADRDGVVIVPKDLAGLVAEYAVRVNEIEETQRRELLEAADDRQTIYERYNRFGHIKPIGKT